TAASSSMPGGRATGSMPAPRSVARRAGDVEARYSRTPAERKGWGTSRRPSYASSMGQPQSAGVRGSELELDVTNIAHGGITVARHEGRVVFVGDAIPGETVVARVTDDSKSKFWRAETVQVLQSSPHRRPHIW